MERWRLPSVRWPMLLLLASIGFTALGVIEANRAIRSQRSVAQHALQDYAGFVAWSYEQHLREVFSKGTQEILGAVNHGEGMHQRPPVPGAQQLPHYLPFDERCGCHRSRVGPDPSKYFAFVLGSDTLGVAINSHPNPEEGWEVDRPLPPDAPLERRIVYPPAERRFINETITKQVYGGSDNGRFPIIIATFDSVPRLLAYTLMPTTWGDTLVYGAEFPRKDVARVLARVMYERGILPETFSRGHSIREMVQLEVKDPMGNVWFASEPVATWALDDTTRMPRAFGSLLVHAQINPAMAGSLVIGGLPRSRLPFLLGLLAVAAALSVVAMAQMRREGELARLRADFVASISHELRTPLAQMRLYLETLRLGRFTTEDQRTWSLDNVERETTRLTHLVERVLRFSRTGRPEADSRERVDALAEVRTIVDEFKPLAAARGTTVELKASAVPSLMLRPAALRHVLLNLLDNAVKYGPTGQVVRVTLRELDGEVRIEVADQGPGVPESDRESIWRPYERGTTAGHTAGSGIGLSIVRDVAEQHGGRAWVEPAALGAVFIVAVPVQREGEPIAVARSSVASTRPVLG